MTVDYLRGLRWRSSWSKASGTQAFSSVQSACTPHTQPVESLLNSHVRRPSESTQSQRRRRRRSGQWHAGPPATALPAAVRCRTRWRPNVVPPWIWHSKISHIPIKIIKRLARFGVTNQGFLRTHKTNCYIFTPYSFKIGVAWYGVCRSFDQGVAGLINSFIDPYSDSGQVVHTWVAPQKYPYLLTYLRVPLDNSLFWRCWFGDRKTIGLYKYGKKNYGSSNCHKWAKIPLHLLS